MDLAQIRRHWHDLASTHRTDLKATTKTSTIKRLEIHALYQAIRSTPLFRKGGRILEVGCGNGYNCLALSRLLPQFDFTGIDYVPEMIENANRIARRGRCGSRVQFFIGDARELDRHPQLKRKYLAVFTDRCLINLNTPSLQRGAFDQLSNKVAVGGFLMILENSSQNFMRQNRCRRILGLKERTPAPYNLFIDEQALLRRARRDMNLVRVDDFGSLHDLILYVLLPSVQKGSVDYLHPLVQKATDLSIALSIDYPNAFGAFGQNRLWVFKKKLRRGS